MNIPTKYILGISGVLLTAIVGCTKTNTGNVNPTKTQPSVLLTQIVDNYPGNADYGKVVGQFVYSGTQLNKYIYYATDNSEGPTVLDTFTYAFNYDNTGRLQTVVETSPQYDNVNPSAPTPQTIATYNFYYSGNYISEVQQYTDYNDGEHGPASYEFDFTFTYQNGQLTAYHYQLVSPVNNAAYYNNDYALTYENGNLYTYGVTLLHSASVSGIFGFTYSNFDNKNSVSKAMSFNNYLFLYYCVGNEAPLFYELGPFGNNNPTTLNYSDTGESANGTYTYQYNSDGFPSSIIVNAPQVADYSFLYTYMKVN